MAESHPYAKIPKRKKLGGFTYFLILFALSCGIVILMPISRGNMEIIIPQFAVTFLVVTMFGSLYQSNQHQISWEQYAREKDFVYHLETVGTFSNLPVISGKYRGHAIRINLFNVPFSTGQRNSFHNAFYTEIEITFPIRTISKNKFELDRKNFSPPREKLIYEPGDERLFDFQTEDGILNRLCRVRASSNDFARRLLNEDEILQGLVDITQQTRELKLTIHDKRLRYYQPGKIMDTVYLHAILDLLVDIALRAQPASLKDQQENES